MRRPRLCVFSVRGDHPLAEQDLHPLLGPVLAEEGSLIDKHFRDIGRVIQQDNVMQQDAVVRCAPIASQVFKEKNGVRRIKETMKPVERQIKAQARRLQSTFPAERRGGSSRPRPKMPRWTESHPRFESTAGVVSRFGSVSLRPGSHFDALKCAHEGEMPESATRTMEH